MIKQTHYCDGCGKKLEGERLKEAQLFSVEFNTEFQRSETAIFCLDRCSRRALDYWSESRDVMNKALAVASKTIEGHKRKFFSSALKEVV